MWAVVANAEDLRGAILIMQLAAAIDVVLETDAEFAIRSLRNILIAAKSVGPRVKIFKHWPFRPSAGRPGAHTLLRNNFRKFFRR